MGQSKVLRALGRIVCPPIFKLLYRYKTIGTENIPETGGYILACNHISYSDPVLLGVSTKRTLYFMAKAELFEKSKFFAGLIKALGAFPVKRGANDGKAINTGESIILNGDIMTIFLEGGRSKNGELMRPRSGCALIAKQTQASVIPACITVIGNPYNTFARRVIHFGKPISVEELGLTGDSGIKELKYASDKIMDRIKEMRKADLNEYKRR